MTRRTSAAVALASLAYVSAWGLTAGAQRPGNTPAGVSAVDEDGPHLGAPDQPRGHDEVLLAQREKAPPDDARELGPREERDDDGGAR